MENEYRAKKLTTKQKWDRAINWMFILGLVFAAYQVGAHYVDDYKAEILYYRLVQDGVQPADMTDAYIRAGVERNLEFRGQSRSAFFFGYWLPMLAWAFLIFVVPMVISVARMRVYKPPSWLHIAYFASMVAWAFLLVYFIGKYLDWI